MRNQCFLPDTYLLKFLLRPLNRVIYITCVRLKSFLAERCDIMAIITFIFTICVYFLRFAYLWVIYLLMWLQLELMADSESENKNNIHRDFYIPTYILALNASSNSLHIPDAPKCPVLVFINSKSGGQLGGELLRTFRHLLNKYQVLKLFPLVHIGKRFKCTTTITYLV